MSDGYDGLNTPPSQPVSWFYKLPFSLEPHTVYKTTTKHQFAFEARKEISRSIDIPPSQILLVGWKKES